MPFSDTRKKISNLYGFEFYTMVACDCRPWPVPAKWWAFSRPYIRSSRIPSCGNPTPVFSAIFPNVALSQHAGLGQETANTPPTLSLCKDFVNGLQLLFFEARRL
ncbi:hypothetical protein CEXT_557731 [Caerostris extrusa]|uniref:Uncharacterized protein n=1 Tax=Caerostris extrusa TaxID=172846 RepID=A0AAV4W6A1_CAEEX|nr:hypothetical protein CEXT_557731 [Caerostris extrusa]